MALERDLARDEAALTVLKNHVSKAAVAVVLELSVKVAEMESSLAGARAELDYLKGRLAEAEAVPPSAATSIATHARSVEEVSRQLEALTPQLAAVEEQLAHVEGQPDPIRIASAPVTPESPVGPHRYVLVGGAALLGIVLGMIVYFGLLTLRVYARELDRA
jgi:uncharacterized coiled-coil protein SlyX